MTEFFVSAEKFKELKERLVYLKSDKRAEVADKIAHARSYGDLSENSEYESAKEEQNFLEVEIAELEEKINNAKIIKKGDAKSDTVTFGSVVEVFDEEFNEKVTYTITGADESDPSKNFISNLSPIGKALMGHKKGEQVTAIIPNGKLSFKILNVKN